MNEQKEKAAHEVQLKEQSICKYCGFDNNWVISSIPPKLKENYCVCCEKKLR